MKLLRLIAIGVTLLLASCIDTREEVWLESDGSGRAEIACSLPASAARLHGGETGVRSMIEAFLKQSPEFTSSSCEVTTMQNRLHVRISAAFDSALDLKNLGTGESMQSLPAAASDLAGKVDWIVSGRTLDFTRTVSAGRAIPGVTLLPDSQWRDRRLVYILHLPAAVADSNATRTENAGRMLVWDIPLADAVKAPIRMHFSMAIAVPWKWLTGIAAPFSVLGILWFIRRRKAKAAALDRSRRPDTLEAANHPHVR